MSANQISSPLARAVFRRDRVGELRAQGFLMVSDRKEVEYKPKYGKYGKRAFLSEEHTLPKTTTARTAIRTGNESSSDHAGPIA